MENIFVAELSIWNKQTLLSGHCSTGKAYFKHLRMKYLCKISRKLSLLPQNQNIKVLLIGKKKKKKALVGIFGYVVLNLRTRFQISNVDVTFTQLNLQPMYC